MSHNPKHTESCYYFVKEKHLTWQEMFRPYLLDQAIPLSVGTAKLRFHEIDYHKAFLKSEFGIDPSIIKIVPTEHPFQFSIQLVFDSEADEAVFIMRMSC